MPDPMFPYVAVDLTVNDTLFQPDGTKLLKAAGRTIDTTDAEAGTDIAPHLVEDATKVIGHGVKTIAVTGTRVALRASSTRALRMTVKALVDNAATLYLGTSTVTNDTNNTTGGFQLSPGEAMTFGIDDVADVYINGTASDGVSFLYEQ
jgi:hypothetical protein